MGLLRGSAFVLLSGLLQVEEGAFVVIVSILELPHEFKELLAYYRKPAIATTLLFNFKVTVPQNELELKIIK